MTAEELLYILRPSILKEYFCSISNWTSINWSLYIILIINFTYSHFYLFFNIQIYNAMLDKGLPVIIKVTCPCAYEFDMIFVY